MGDEPRGTLASRRLWFEPPREGDAAETAAAMTPAVAQWLLSFHTPYTKDDAIRRIQLCRRQIAAGEALHFVLRARDGRALIGWISAWRTDREGEWELGFWIAERFQGRALGFEAVAFLLDHLAATVRPRIILAIARPENVRSIAILRKLGLSQCGETMRFVAACNGERPFLVFRLTSVAEPAEY